ncbi:glycosyltransferase family 2 protein [Hirschia maritima]|uniref:glycosyltransferase family 2 protein n=1 Tax=Hirschia maritima TaxID=1121961 RepID=UPI0003A73CFB|nr:glycosyltransferase family 2 protein [Hirschia maritima]
MPHPHESSYPLVVVATPVYNGGKYLRETMECVQAQTYPNLLHVVINNASTDNTASIIDEYLNAKVPIKLITHKKLIPVGENWNSAVEAVPENAKWVRWMCADDTMSPEAIAKTVEIGESDPEIGIVGCIRDINGKIDPPLWPENQTVFFGKNALSRFFENKGKIMGPHVLYKREAMLPYTPFFELNNIALDTDAVLRILTKWKMGFCHQHLAFTRHHEETQTSQFVTPTRLHLFDWFLFVNRYAQYAYSPKEAKQMRNRYKRHYLRRLMNARRLGDGKKMWNSHMEKNSLFFKKPTVWDFIDASIDGILIKLKVRPQWLPYPW